MGDLKTLASGLTEPLVYIAIALVTLVGVIKCIYPVFRNAALLNRAVVKLEKTAGNREKPVWREARFLGRSLRQDWQRFLLNAGQLDMRGMPCDTSEYVNEDTVIYKPGHSQMAELIPSLLTSLGILGTFIGLMEGLTSLDFSDAATTIESIPTLLGGMKFAFATSVAGISCSLAFNMVNRIAVGRAFKALDGFDEAFYELAMPRPLDMDTQLLCQKQDEGANAQHTAQMFAGQLAGTMEMAISRAIHPLTMSMDNFVQGASREQIDGVQRIVGQFVQQMNRSLGGQLGELSGTIASVNDTQREAQENLRHTMEATAELAEEAKRIQQASHEIADKMEAGGVAAELTTLLKDSLEQQHELSRNLTEVQRQMAENAEISQRAMTESVRSLAERVAALEPTTERRAAFEQELAELTISLGHMRVALDDLAARAQEESARPGKHSRARRFFGMKEGA